MPKKLIKTFKERYPIEKGMFWTPDYEGVITFIRIAYFTGYRQGIIDSEKKYTKEVN